MRSLSSTMTLIVGLLMFPTSGFGSCLSEVMDVPDSGWRDASTKPIEERLLKHSQPPNKITIHYTGVKKNEKLPLQKKLKGLYRFSTTEKTPFKKQLWGDVPYNFYIDAHGKMAQGRSTDFRPDTNTNYNPDGHITVVVEGGPGDDLSSDQKSKLFSTIKALQNQFSIPTAEVGTHKHYASTSCPGEAVGSAVEEYKKLEKNYKPQKCTTGSKSRTEPASDKPRARQ